MNEFRAKINPFTGQLQLVPTNIVLAFKEGVATQANLPLTGNAKGDARIANDTGHLYVWSIEATSGLLTDWVDAGDIVDLTWAALSGKPSSTPANIDDAVSKKHTQGTDQKIDDGGASETTAAEIRDSADKKHTQNSDIKLAEGTSNEVTAANAKDAVDKKHEHTNKITLDAIQEALTTALKNAYDGAVTDSHTHSNKATLDLIEEAFTTALKNAYDNAVTKAHEQNTDYILKLNISGLPDLINNGTLKNDLLVDALITIDGRDLSIDGSKLDGIEAGAVALATVKADGDIASAIANDHTHSNKATLDSIQEALTTALKAAYDDAVTKAHTQNTDTKLDNGGANEISASEIIKATIAAINYYIDNVGGSDITGDGTIGNPFQTIQHAIDLLPKFLRHTVTIYLNDSLTYNEAVNINGFIGTGEIIIVGLSSDATKVLNTATVSNNAFTITDCSVLIKFNYISSKIITNAYTCYYYDNSYGSVVECKAGDNGNTTTNGITSINGSRVFAYSVSDIDANKVATGLYTLLGGVIGHSNVTLGDTATSVATGGFIIDAIVLSGTDYNDSISKKHTQGTDQGLDNGGANAVTALTIKEDIYQSGYNEGLLSEPTIADVGGTAVSVTSVDVLIRSTTDFSGGILIRKTVPQNTSLSLTDDSLNYIYVDYNSGTPIYKATINRADINNSSTILVARVMMRSGAVEYVAKTGATALSLVSKNFDKQLQTRGIKGIEKESGFGLSETATRIVNIASGVLWFGDKRTSLGAIAQGGGGVVSDLWYHLSGVWTKTTATNYNNTQYDDGTDLQNVSNNKYAVNWIFRNIETNEIDIVLGNGDYTLAQAEASEVPSLPDDISYFYLLVGRIIVEKGIDTATAIESIRVEILNPTIISEHNDLGSIQGGSASERYHLTATELSDAQDAISKKHTQGTDQALDAGGANEITAANAKAAYTHSGVTSGNPHSVNKSDVGLGNVENLKVKLDATSAPTVNDDIDLGYSVGSRWINITADKEYVCLDNTDGAAVWTETTQSGGASGTSGTFVNGDLVTGKLTVTHNLTLDAPYQRLVIVVDNNGKMIIPDDITFATNSFEIDLTSFGTITGTWGYRYL